ncbi:MAG: response regulator [Alphaproteobacteria bacterium]
MTLAEKNILVIDDTASIRTFLRISLQAHGAKFHEAGSGEEGIRLCKHVQPDLIVLDLGLPDKDGLDVLPEIKQNDTKPKVIILSVRKDPVTRSRAAELGADDYMTKPFLMEDLLEVIEKNLQE